MSGPDWNALVTQGRAKALGVPWSDAELKAIYEEKVPVEYVRNGCLTQVAFTALQSGHAESKPNAYKKKPELVKEAKARGIDFDEEAISRSDLLIMLQQHDNALIPT